MHVHEEMSRDLVVIPIRDGSKKTEAVYSTHDGVTVINILTRLHFAHDVK